MLPAMFAKPVPLSNLERRANPTETAPKAKAEIDPTMATLTFGRLVNPQNGVTGWAIFGGHEHIARNFVCWREVEREDGRVDLVWCNPSVFGPDPLRSALRSGNERIGIDTLNHSRPLLWIRTGKDSTATIAPRLILEGDCRDRILDMIDAAWKAPTAYNGNCPFHLTTDSKGNVKVTRKVGK